MWIYGPSREEKSKRLHRFDKYPAGSLPFKIAAPPLKLALCIEKRSLFFLFPKASVWGWQTKSCPIQNFF